MFFPPLGPCRFFDAAIAKEGYEQVVIEHAYQHAPTQHVHA